MGVNGMTQPRRPFWTPTHCFAGTSLTALKLKDLLPPAGFPGAQRPVPAAISGDAKSASHVAGKFEKFAEQEISTASWSSTGGQSVQRTRARFLRAQ